MTREFTTAELEAYLDEALSPEIMVAVEAALRTDNELAQRLAAIHGRRDSGLHSLGEIWRRHRASCPSREQLGSYLLGVLDEANADYVRFHVEESGCRICQANLSDMQQQQREATDKADHRRHRYFQSSAGFLQEED